MTGPPDSSRMPVQSNNNFKSRVSLANRRRHAICDAYGGVQILLTEPLAQKRLCQLQPIPCSITKPRRLFFVRDSTGKPPARSRRYQQRGDTMREWLAYEFGVSGWREMQ